MEKAVDFKTDRKQRTSQGLRIRYSFQSSYVEDLDLLGVDVCAEKDLGSFFSYTLSFTC